MMLDKEVQEKSLIDRAFVDKSVLERSKVGSVLRSQKSSITSNPLTLPSIERTIDKSRQSQMSVNTLNTLSKASRLKMIEQKTNLDPFNMRDYK